MRQWVWSSHGVESPGLSYGYPMPQMLIRLIAIQYAPHLAHHSGACSSQGLYLAIRGKACLGVYSTVSILPAASLLLVDMEAQVVYVCGPTPAVCEDPLVMVAVS